MPAGGGAICEFRVCGRASSRGAHCNDCMACSGLCSRSVALGAPGTFEAEKIVDMRRHDYRLEPNITFTPNGQWMVFRSNMDGSNQVYAVKVTK